tara:strand:- start:2303 stop:2431 length:129 start_codon:yes stop_codon:yes gene_type:complete
MNGKSKTISLEYPVTKDKIIGLIFTKNKIKAANEKFNFNLNT